VAAKKKSAKGKPLSRERKAAIAAEEVKPPSAPGPKGPVDTTTPITGTKHQLSQTSFTREIAAEVCERMARGESLRAICRSPHMPDESTVRLWAVNDIDGFKARYASAREAQMEALAEDLIEISDDKKEDVNRDRLRIDTRKWIMARVSPKKFGDRVTNEVVGDGGGPVKVDVAGMSDEKLASLEALLLDVTGGAARPSSEGESGEGTS